MKRNYKTLIIVILCVLLGATLLLGACKEPLVTVTFDPLHEGASPVTRTVQKGTTVSPPTLTIDGYQLEGWYLDDKLTERATESDFVVIGDIIFYAKWQADPVDVVLTGITLRYTGDPIPFGSNYNVDLYVEVTAHYSDGSSHIVESNSDRLTINLQFVDGDEPHAVLSVQYTEDDVTKSAEIKVATTEPPVTLESITAEYTGERLFVGDTFDESKIEVIAYFSDGTSYMIGGFEVGVCDTSTPGDKTVTVSLTFGQTTVTDDVTITVLPIELDSITVVYTGGELEINGTVNPSDVAVTAWYTNGKSSTVTNFTLSDTDTSTGGDKVVTVTYTEDDISKTAQFTVTVVVRLASISVSYKDVVIVGEKFSASDVAVTAHYTDGSSQVVSNFTLSEIDVTTVGVKTVTVIYVEDGVTKTAEITVNVLEAELVSIQVSYDGGDVYVGQSIDKDKVTVVAYFNNNTNLTVYGFKLSATSFDQAGEQTITVMYTAGDKTVTGTFTVNVLPLVLQRIVALYNGGNLQINDVVNKDDIVVIAYYNIGSGSIVTDFTLSPIDTSSGGDKIVTVSYTENDITVTAQFTVTVVVQLSFITADCSVQWLDINAKLDASTLTVTAHYTDGSCKVVTDYTLSPIDTSSGGYKTVTVSYTENDITVTAQFTVTVVVRLSFITADCSVQWLDINAKFDASTLTVTAHYTDGSCKVVTDYSLSPIDTSSGGDKIVTVSYTENDITVTAHFTVTVVVRLSFITADCSVQWLDINAKLDPSTLTVTAHYTDGSCKVVTDYTLSPIDTSTAREITVEVTYAQDGVTVSASFVVEVIVRVTHIQVEYVGAPLEINGTLSSDDVVVTAYFTDNTQQRVYDFTLSQVDTSKAATLTVVVTYADSYSSVQAQFTVDVVVRLVNIVATYTGDVKVGVALDETNLTVTATYTDGSSKQVIGYTLSQTVFTEIGKQSVTVTYTDRGVTKQTMFTVNVIPATLVRIEAKYFGGNILVDEQPDIAQLTVTAYYDNNTSKVVNPSVGTINSSVAGKVEWRISYSEDGVTVETSVTITVVSTLGPLEPQEGKYDVNVITNEQLSIHFLELGNGSIGDSVYIKAGDTDILIDAGSKRNSAPTLVKYIKQYCTDGVLEYVIATHAHEDHIAGFVGSSNDGIFDNFVCETIIEFAKYNSTSQISKDYFAKRTKEKEEGANVYTALECVENSNGAQKIYNLTEDGSITLEILDQKYYHQKASGENNHSVCALISQGDYHYLFTGDLEKEGEESLVAYNPNLPEVELYKGGHHGSSTSSNEVLMQKIKPKCVCVCSCAGSVEYSQLVYSGTFPTQDFINRVAPYTDRVYVTSQMSVTYSGSKYSNNKVSSLNGNIVFACTNGQITMYFSNSNLKLKDTDWFKEYRTCPSAWA